VASSRFRDEFIDPGDAAKAVAASVWLIRARTAWQLRQQVVIRMMTTSTDCGSPVQFKLKGIRT
jgi:hypothetical protein